MFLLVLEKFPPSPFPIPHPPLPPSLFIIYTILPSVNQLCTVVEPRDLSANCSMFTIHAKKKKKVVFSFPSQQPDGEAVQPVGIEDETSKNEVRTTRKSNV